MQCETGHDVLLATIVHKAHKKKQPVGKPKNPFADFLEFLLLVPSAFFVAITDVTVSDSLQSSCQPVLTFCGGCYATRTGVQFELEQAAI